MPVDWNEFEPVELPTQVDWSQFEPVAEPSNDFRRDELAKQTFEARLEGEQAKLGSALATAGGNAAYWIADALAKVDPTGVSANILARQEVPRTPPILALEDIDTMVEVAKRGLHIPETARAEGKLGEVTRGLSEAGKELVSGFTDPGMIAGLYTGKYLPQDAARMFQAQMIGALPATAQHALESQNLEEAVQRGVGLAGNIAFPIALGGPAAGPSVRVPDFVGRQLEMQRGALPPRGEPVAPVERVTPEQSALAAERMSAPFEGKLASEPSIIATDKLEPVDTESQPKGLIESGIESGIKSPEIAKPDTAEIIQMLQDSIATKKANGEKVPQAWIDKLGQLKEQQPTAGGYIFSDESVPSHTLNSDNPILPIKLLISEDSLPTIQRRWDDAQKRIEAARVKLRTAKGGNKPELEVEIENMKAAQKELQRMGREINDRMLLQQNRGQIPIEAIDPFERARTGEEKAFDELDAQFREIYPDEIDFGRPGRPDPNQVHTPKAFADIFNRAFAARDFDTILNSVKATSDVSIWKPFLKDLFSKQANDPIAAQKAEWFRHVFNGTVPPEAIPKAAPRTSAPRQAPPVTPPPRPSAGPPPPRPSSTPPSPPPVRILVDPILGGGAKSPYKIIEDFSARIGKAIRVLRMKKGGLGVYRPGSTLTAERFAGDLDTAAHELAGHWTDDVHGIGKPWVTPRTRSPYDSELAKFWIHGSVKPTSTLRYRRAEGIAEYIRAYVVNPTQAKLDAPTFSAYFERTLPPDALKAIQDFSKDVRIWAGENPITRAGLNIRMEPPTLMERLWKGIRGRGFGFEVNPIDRLRQMFDDSYHFAVKADKAIQELSGKKQLPSEEFELTARLLSGHDARMSDQFENGLTPLRPGQSPNAKGTLEVERITDPVTQQPMTMKWLMDAFDKSNTDAFKKDMRDASAYMIAQRTVEKSGQLGRDVNVSGIGAGIMTDVQAATELLAEVGKNPAQEARLKEAARRYRLWADQNIQMLVDSGRISRGQARAIRENNQQYVDMHRLSEEFEVANRAQRGGHIGTAKDLIRRFKGSSLELDNVYSNLLEQTDSIQKEAHRNLVMNNFTDGLNHVRELHGPDLKDFDQFGRKVTSEDKNTIRVFKNGKGEYWQFDPAIYESLKGLGELQTNWVFNALVAPSRLARYLITRGPSFMIRNPLRDTFERSVNSRSGGKPWDIFQGYSKEELSRYESFGGGQFGNYIIDRHVWNREIKKVMREMVKDPKNILLSPLKLKHGWEALGEKSEKIGRIAEFRRAFETGKKQIAAEHPNLTSKEVEYNAALYAAGQARGLLDFAKAGTVMKYINQAIPFSNAGLRGLAKSVQGAKENPARYAMNWGMFVLAPTLAVMMWNKRDEETWKEYLQLPSYRRDFFWNFKVGDMWVTVPKPHLLGVLAGGVERMLLGIMGEKHSMEGLGKSIGNALPVSNIAESSGPLKMFLELSYNRDSFRQRDIVPDWEKDLKLELRKTEYASGAGRGIAGAINSTGLELDPRQVDYVLNSMGGWGSIVTSFSRKNMMPAETGLRSTGLFTSPPGTEAKDVQWVMDWARANNKTSSPDMRELRNLRTDVFEATTMKERSEAAKALRDYASDLRENIDSELEPVE